MFLPGPGRFTIYIASFVLWSAALMSPRATNAQSNEKSGEKPGIDWVAGPTTARLGDIAEIKIPAGYRFTGKAGTAKFLEITQNPPSDTDLGTIIPESAGESENSDFWFVIFEFDDVGYVKDDDRNKLDADALLKSIQNNTEEGNKQRATRGWPAYHVTSWFKPPYYDVKSNNLTWAMQGYSVTDNKQEQSVNYSVRILGRRGTMNADLVLDPHLVEKVVPNFESLLSGFSFLPGGSYAEFRSGDKIAKYGLATLVAGGATALAVKTGLLAKLWKLIVVGLAGLAGLLKRAWAYLKRVLSGKAADETPQQG